MICLFRRFMVALAFAITTMAALPSLVAAQDFPALFNVVGVNRGDVLNIRAQPGAGSAIIGALAPGARDIEVIRTNGNWGLVKAGETAGWVSMAYLARIPNQQVYPLSRVIACYGTEPFWSFVITQQDKAQLDQPGGETRQWSVGLLQSSANRGGRYSLRGENHGIMAAVIAKQRCSDGMSDREFGLAIDLLLRGRHLTGCCELRGN